MRTVICRPLHGTPVLRNERAVRDLSKSHGWDVLELAGPNLNLVRAALAEAAIRDGADMVLWVDSDIVFGTDAALGVVEKAAEVHGLVGALYPEKRLRGSVQAEFDLEPGTEIRCWSPGSPLVPCSAIGLGLAAHPVSLLTDTAERIGLLRQRVNNEELRPWFTPSISDPNTTTDDYALCRNLRRAGFQVFADTRWKVEHVGEYGYTLADCVRSAEAGALTLRAGWVV